MKYIIVHNLGGTESDPLFDTSDQTFGEVNEYHRQKWNFKSSLGYYLGYNYFISKDGTTTQARADNEKGAHTIGHNDDLGIVLAGNFDYSLPTPEQVKALKSLLLVKSLRYGIKRECIVPHRKFSDKSCYGKNLSDTWASDLLNDERLIPSACLLDTPLQNNQGTWYNIVIGFLKKAFLLR